MMPFSHLFIIFLLFYDGFEASSFSAFRVALYILLPTFVNIAPPRRLNPTIPANIGFVVVLKRAGITELARTAAVSSNTDPRAPSMVPANKSRPRSVKSITIISQYLS